MRTIFVPDTFGAVLASAASLWSFIALGLYTTRRVLKYVTFGTTDIDALMKESVQAYSDMLFVWHIILYSTIAGGILLTFIILAGWLFKERHPFVVSALQLGAWVVAVGWFIFANAELLINSTTPSP